MELLPPDNFLVENKTQGATGEFHLSWKKSFLAESYSIYRSYVPYGSGDLIAENITDLEFDDPDAHLIDGTSVHYRVTANRGNQSVSTAYQRAQNTNEYVNYSGSNEWGETVWNNQNSAIYDPHSNKYPTFGNKQSYQPGTVNPLPSNILRPYQIGKILRDILWLLQDTGELVYLIKQKRMDYSQPNNEDQNRATGRTNYVEYYEPIIICAHIASPGQTHVINKNGTALEKQTSSWTLHTPELCDGDIIITNKNERFEIQNVVHQRSWRGASDWQRFDIKQLGPRDNVYSHPSIKNVNGTALNAKKHFWD